MSEGGQKLQTYSYKISHMDVMYSRVTITDTVLYSWKLLRKEILVLITRKKILQLSGDRCWPDILGNILQNIYKYLIIMLYVCLRAQLCLILCDPMDCIPPSSSIHGIFQARIPD